MLQRSLLPRCISSSALTSLILAGSVLQVAAQNGSMLAGTITDPTGNALPNAVLVIRNEQTGYARTLNADTQGRFSAASLPTGRYTVEASATGFALARRTGVEVSPTQPQQLALALPLGDVTQQVTVEGSTSNSLAAQLAPMDALLDARSARTEISSPFINNFTSPVSDYSELLQMAPGTFSVNPNGIGLGDSKTFFRGFADGNYDITFDGIPFNDTNSPTHHSWAFFPSQWIGGVDFDRSPGSASTIGPTPFGGSINLLSKEMPFDQSIRGGVSYGSFNTLLLDFNYDSGHFGGANKKSDVLIDFNRLTSDGFETNNYQTRNAGALKYQYKFSETRVLTGFSGVLLLDTNTPNFKGPLRSQVAALGYNYLLNKDPNSAAYYRYNFYHLPTDFEYVGFKSALGHGWTLDTKPYTYSYYNQQNYANSQTGLINDRTCASVKGVIGCGTDKLNSYRKYGEVTSLNQVSRFGIFRTGFWYEWATTSRHQTPQDVRTLADSVLPNFNEQFWTNSYQPFGEYEYHPTSKLSVTGGLKFAYYNQDLKQYADNGKTIGSVDPVTKAPFAFRRSSGGYSSWLPSADVNYRIKQNWSVYGQFATGSIIPPSSVFDVTGQVSTLPKPSYAKTYQTGSVLKLRRMTLDADFYYINYGNAYTASPDPNIATATQYSSSGTSITKGFEAETNVYLAKGLSFYGNGTVGFAHYSSQAINGVANPNYNRLVANTPANTEALGITYQQKFFDLSIFNKRVGPMWNDGTATIPIAGSRKTTSYTANQFIPIDPFNVTNAFINFTVRNGSHLDQTKLRFSVNNLFDTRQAVGVNQGATGATYTQSPNDILTLLPGRSIMVTAIFGFAPRR